MPTVQPGDPLQAALDALSPGAVLRLAPGEFCLAAPLHLRRGIRIVGAGAARTRLVRPRAPHALVAEAHPPTGEVLTLEGLTIGWVEGDDGLPGTYLFQSDVLVVAGGRVDLRGCRLAGSEAEHRRSNDDLYGGSGLRVEGAAEVRVEGCEVVNHGGHGLVVGATAKATMANCWVAGNRGAGLLVESSATAEAHATAFTDNVRGGVAAFDDAALVLVTAMVQVNGRFGVRLAASRDARLEGCTIEGNSGPGVLVEAGSPLLARGAIRGNSGDGVAVAAGRQVVMTELVIEENRGFGVALGRGATADLADAVIFHNARGRLDRAGEEG